MRYKSLYIIIFLYLALISKANTNTIYNNYNYSIKPNINISFREVLWAITHPFIAIKVKNITKEAMATSRKIGKEQILTDISGGNLDAFKHTYWMALLSQQIKRKKAHKLGKIHEKVNYNSFKRGDSSHDSIASAMDLLNNKLGINIGENNKTLNKEDLITIVIKNIKAGKMYIISKDSFGNYLDCDNRIIDLSKENKWHKRKCLISSE